jgi:hypothetical protein
MREDVFRFGWLKLQVIEGPQIMYDFRILRRTLNRAIIGLSHDTANDYPGCCTRNQALREASTF